MAEADSLTFWGSSVAGVLQASKAQEKAHVVRYSNERSGKA